MPETQICKYYPPWFRRILDFQALCHTEGGELRAMADAMDQIHKNLFVQTMDEVYIEAPAAEKDYFTEVSALLNIVKPCHIVYIARPRLDSGLLLPEKVSRGVVQYNYILGQWRLGESPLPILRNWGF